MSTSILQCFYSGFNHGMVDSRLKKSLPTIRTIPIDISIAA